MKTQVIIPTAGLGVRLQSDVPKQLVEINGKPIFIHTLLAVQECSSVDSIILVAQKYFVDRCKSLAEEYGLNKVKKIVAGGKYRRESVQKGIEELDEDTKVVVIHDGVRPLISSDTINEAISLCEKENAVIVAVPVKPTIKRINEASLYVEATLKRNELWEVQTPQVFKKDILIEAHNLDGDIDATDDAFLVEKLGINVKVLKGDYRNIKITTKEDIKIAEAFLGG